MKKEIIYTLEEIKKDILKNNGLNYIIVYMKDTYCLLKARNKYYYIQNEYFGGVSITLYNKIDYNTKRQADYPKELKSFNDLLNYITETKNKHFDSLKDTHNQTIFYQLLTIKNGRTIFQHLKEIAGYREQYILKNMDCIIEEESTENYHILCFIDKEGNYFKINTKNIERLIVG